jgi:hypothetical protein
MANHQLARPKRAVRRLEQYLKQENPKLYAAPALVERSVVDEDDKEQPAEDDSTVTV